MPSRLGGSGKMQDRLHAVPVEAVDQGDGGFFLSLNFILARTFWCLILLAGDGNGYRSSATFLISTWPLIGCAKCFPRPPRVSTGSVRNPSMPASGLAICGWLILSSVR